jgi:hypothetical protein
MLPPSADARRGSDVDFHVALQADAIYETLGVLCLCLKACGGPHTDDLPVAIATARTSPTSLVVLTAVGLAGRRPA